MKIEAVSLAKKEKRIVLSAKVHFRGYKPETMYFATDAKNADYIMPDASPFLAAVLLPCMKTGEDIEIDGIVSPVLLKNTKKIMSLVGSWHIGLKPIKITAVIPSESAGWRRSREISSPQDAQMKRSLRALSLGRDDKRRVGSFFSAGVDSFYTYLKHKDITDFIFIHGFDIPLKNKSLFEKVNKNIQKIATKEKVHLLSIETNVADIIEPKLIWDFAHGGALASVCLFLRKKLASVYIASAVKKHELFPYGTHPKLDKLWSTETFQVIHDGTEYNRLEKIMHVVAKSDLALGNLHVCAQNLKGQYNCSRCHKCLTTMIELICADVSKKATTFSWPIDLRAVRKMYYDYALIYNTQGEAHLALLRRKKREPELQKAIQYSLLKSKNPGMPKKVYKFIAYMDQKYNKRRLYKAVFQLTGKQDRNRIFKLLFRLRLLK